MSRSAPVPRLRLKYLASINDETLGEDTDPDFDIRYIDIGNVDSFGNIEKFSNYLFGDAPSRARRRVRDGDVIVSTVRTYLQAIAQVRNPPENMIVSTGFAVVRPGAQFDVNYCKYALREEGFLAEVAKRSVGVNYPAINAIDLGNIPVYTHHLSHQRAIAEYLDRETARLDELAAAKERFMALLAEKRQALIDGVITGRMTPRRPGDSGDNSGIKGNNESERSPEHRWQTKRLRFLTSDGRSDDRRKILADAENVTFLPMNKIGDRGEIDCSSSRNIDEIRGGYTQFFDGDILVAKITPCFENGKGALVRGTLSGVGYGTTELHVLTPRDEVDGRFLYYVTVSKTFRDLGEAAMYGAAGQKRVPEDFIRNFRAPVPGLAQQRAIADYLDRETARLDELEARTRDAIALLKERRAALVSAAVSGQIGVDGGGVNVTGHATQDEGRGP